VVSESCVPTGKEKALEMLADAGFTNVDMEQVAGDAGNNYYIVTKG
jgi:Zn-dependent membrane protease YugP